MSYPFHSDAGHGWLEVPMQELKELGIDQAISPYSYISEDEQTAYLEEDCDCSTWAVAYGMKHGAIPEFDREHHRGDAPCRYMRHYPCSPHWKRNMEAVYDRGRQLNAAEAEVFALEGSCP